MKIYTYRVIIEPDKKNTYHGFVPALPGCHTCGQTIEETKKHLKEVIQLYIETLIMDNEPVPKEEGLEYFETISTKDLELAAK